MFKYLLNFEVQTDKKNSISLYLHKQQNHLWLIIKMILNSTENNGKIGFFPFLQISPTIQLKPISFEHVEAYILICMWNVITIFDRTMNDSIGLRINLMNIKFWQWFSDSMPIDTYLSSWEFFQEGFGFVGHTKFKIRCYINLNAGEFSGNERFICAEIFRIRVQSLIFEEKFHIINITIRR